MKTETRNGLFFLGAIIIIVALVYKKSPVLQAEAKNLSENK